MQNVSNLQEEMEAKEPFMHPMNFLMPESVQRVKSFIEELVQIDQKEGMSGHFCTVCVYWCWCSGVQCLLNVAYVMEGTSTMSSSARDFCGRGTLRQPWGEVSSTARDTLN